MPVEVSPVAGTSSNVLKQQLHMQLPAGLSRGSVQVEVVRGGFISRSKVLGCLCLAGSLTVHCCLINRTCVCRQCDSAGKHLSVVTDVTLAQLAYMHWIKRMLIEPVDALQTVSGHWQALV